MNDNISNRRLLPALKPDGEVRLIRSDEDGLIFTPDWFGSLIMVELHPETATAEGTLESLTPVLDHLADLGVNGIWVTPIYKKGRDGNGYGNWGPDTLEPSLTGTEDIDEGWKRVREFVERAHERRIRVFLDIISWGVVFSSPLRAAHPDWFRGEAWGGAAFDWSCDEFRAWYIDVCIDKILKSGADGYRCDCEPMFSGDRVFAEVRTRLLALGRKIAIIAEESCERRGTYDCEQDGVTGWINWSRAEQYKSPRAYYLEGESIVDCIKTGKLHGSAKSQRDGSSGRERFYTYCVSNHDFHCSFTNLNRLKIGYQAIFAPYIPLWYLGAEFGMTAGESGAIYFVPVDRSLLEKQANRDFCNDIARYISIRRSYPEIFEYFPLDHREGNIAHIDSDTRLESYARFANGRAVLIVPRSDEERSEFSVSALLTRLGITKEVNRLRDLLTGADIPFSSDGGRLAFKAVIPEKERIGVYLAE